MTTVAIQKIHQVDAAELELKYLPHIQHRNGVLLFQAEVALQLLDDCSNSEVQLLGVEAFRLFPGGGIQPAMEFSNISFGQIDEVEGKFQCVELKRGLRAPWTHNPRLIEHTRSLVSQGVRNGYSWYEVSLEDPATGELLFFRTGVD